jgi:hypothetical protein
MPEEMPVGGIVQQLLGNTDDGGALATASELVGLSLAQREADGSIRLHDLQLDYIRIEHEDQRALALIREAILLFSWFIARDGLP